LLSNNTTEKDERMNCLGAPNVHLGRIENSRRSSRNRLSAAVYGSSGARPLHQSFHILELTFLQKVVSAGTSAILNHENII